MSGNKRGVRSGFGNVRLTGAGRYQARYTHPQTKAVVTAPDTFARKQEADDWLADQRLRVRRGDLTDPNSGKVSFGEYAETWVEEHPLRPHTRQTYRSQVAHIIATFRHWELRSITATDVRAWYATVCQERGISGSTRAKVYMRFKQIMQTAVNDDRVRKNPCQIKRGGVEDLPPIEAPLPQEVELIAEAILPRFALMVRMAASCGLRFGELAGLRCKDVDMDSRTIYVTAQGQSIPGEGFQRVPPKTSSGIREVRFSKRLAERIEDHLDEFVGGEPDALLFTSTRGTPLQNPTFRRWWLRALEATGLQGLVFHRLRHTSGTQASRVGASVPEIQARLGHSTPRAALRYVHASRERDAEIAELMDAEPDNLI